jgi:hypothetical protein
LQVARLKVSFLTNGHEIVPVLLIEKLKNHHEKPERKQKKSFCSHVTRLAECLNFHVAKCLKKLY